MKMSESAINRRKSQLFLNSISPVHNTHDEVVKKKLKRGKFPQTKAGIIKMISLCLQLGSVISWVVLERGCGNLGVTYSAVGSTCLGFIIQLFFFLMFSLGATIKDPGFWINLDIALNFVASLLTLVTSIFAMKLCKVAYVQHLAAIFAISGAAISACGCAAIFLMYRFIEDPDTGGQAPKPTPRDPRKSIFA